MPTNTHGGFTTLRAPGPALLPKAVQSAANAYNLAVTKIAEAQVRRDALAHPNAVEVARQTAAAADAITNPKEDA